MTQDTQSDPVAAQKREGKLVLHGALVDRHNTLNQLLWEAPVISLTAQAFLLTIAFDKDQSEFYRSFSGVIAAVIGMLSWQLFIRHAAFEIYVSEQLEQREIELFGESVHTKPCLQKVCFITQWKSRKLWAVCLFLISLAGLLPFVKFSVNHFFPGTI